MALDRAFETILYKKQTAIAEIRLNRPHRLNAVIEQLYEEVTAALGDAEADPAVRVVVLTGQGKAFCAGADLKAHSSGERSEEQRQRYLRLGQETCRRLRTLGKPVIAAVNGYAIGGGLELAVSADLMVIKESAEVGLPEISIGTYVGGGVTRLLPQLVGLAKAREMIFLGERIGGREAVAIGLATRAFPDEAFDQGVQGIAEALAQKAPVPLAFAKQHLNEQSEQSYEASLEAEVQALLACMKTRDWREGVEAFAQKRAPRFTGR